MGPGLPLKEGPGRVTSGGARIIALRVQVHVGAVFFVTGALLKETSEAGLQPRGPQSGLSARHAGFEVASPGSPSPASPCSHVRARVTRLTLFCLPPRRGRPTPS